MAKRVYRLKGTEAGKALLGGIIAPILQGEEVSEGTKKTVKELFRYLPRPSTKVDEIEDGSGTALDTVRARPSARFRSVRKAQKALQKAEHLKKYIQKHKECIEPDVEYLKKALDLGED